MDLVFLAFAGILGWLAWTSFREARDGHARWTRGLAATPVTVAELVAMAGSVRDELDAPAFRQVVSLSGTVEPLDDEARPAPLTGVDSVWFRFVEEALSRGRDDREERQVVAEQRRERPFRLTDGGAEVVVDPRDARTEIPVAERRRVTDDGGGREFGLFRLVDPTVARERTEWRIEPGSRLTVVGEARLSGDRVRLSAAAGHPLTLTVAERGDHLERSRRRSGTAMRRAVAFGCGAVVALLVAVLS